MVLYQFYNTDILDIPTLASETALAYMDNTNPSLVPNFDATYDMLKDMMTREGSIYDWSKTHNSLHEHFKLVLIDFTYRTNKIVRPNLILLNITIKPLKYTNN